MPSRLPDEELARRATAGERECFEELLTRYRDRVYRICYRTAGNAEDAEDWAQECFVRVYRQLRRYDPTMPFAPWLLRVVANSCINLAKSRERRQGRLELGLPEEMVKTAEDSASSNPLDRIVAAEDERRALAAIEDLPPALKVAVVLRVLEDLTFRELADVLGVPLQTAATRVRRALAQVRERLGESRGSRESGSEVDR